MVQHHLESYLIEFKWGQSNIYKNQFDSILEMIKNFCPSEIQYNNGTGINETEYSVK